MAKDDNFRDEDQSNLSVIGSSPPQLAASKLVTGTARFISDIVRPRMLHGLILRSPHAHARILRIDTTAAESIPGVKAVITAQDTPMIKYGFQSHWPRKLPLEAEKVRYVGDEVAAVAAVDLETAERAIAAIVVEYEVLPAVFDVLESMQPGAPQLHEEDENNIVARLALKDFGDVEKGFAESHLIVEDRFFVKAQAHVCMETRSAVAEYGADGKLTLWASTQFPHVLRNILARVLDMPEKKLRVLKTHMGGAFGARQSIDPINPICCILAMRAGRPVKLVKTREEEFETDRTRHPMVMDIKTGVSKDGHIIARHMKIVTDTGAYHDQAVAVTGSAANKISNLYRSEHCRIEGVIVTTNKVFGGAFRGYGNPQATFAIESQMDMIAGKLGMDPTTLRLMNCNQQGETMIGGAEMIHCEFQACIEQSAAAADWTVQQTSRAKFRGAGMACFVHTGGGARGAHANSFSSTMLKINDDGGVELFTGTPDIGQGSDTAIAMCAAEELGIPVGDITVVSADTMLTPSTLGVRGSRETYLAGNSARKAARIAKQELIERGAPLLQAEQEDCDLKHGAVFVTSDPGRRITIPEIVAPREPGMAGAFPMATPIVAAASYVDEVSVFSDSKTGYGNTCPTWAFGAQVAEVEVDVETGHVKVLQLTGAYDVGKALNRKAVEGQMEGGSAQGLGYALWEDYKWDDEGRLLNGNLADYQVATPMDMPPMKTILIETVDPTGPYGAKGVGEAGMIPTAAAIANAIYAATGVRIRELPLSPERVLRAIGEQGIRDNMKKSA